MEGPGVYGARPRAGPSRSLSSAGGFARVGDRQCPARLDYSRPRSLRQPVGDGTGLAGAGPADDAHRTGDGPSSLLLLRRRRSSNRSATATNGKRIIAAASLGAAPRRRCRDWNNRSSSGLSSRVPLHPRELVVSQLDRLDRSVGGEAHPARIPGASRSTAWGWWQSPQVSGPRIDPQELPGSSEIRVLLILTDDHSVVVGPDNVLAGAGAACSRGRR